MGFRVRQAVTLGLTAICVALATGLISAAILVRLHVLEARDHAELLARTLFHLTSQAIRHHPDDLRQAVAGDDSLREYADAVVGYSPIVLNVAIKDPAGVAILHSDARKQGRRVITPETFADFSKRNALSQLWIVLDGQRDLSAELPIGEGDRPLGTVAVSVSTVLLRQNLLGAVVTNAIVAGIAVLLAFLAAFLVSNRLLAPIARLRAELARIVPADDLKSDADINRLVEFFTTVSERLAAGRNERDAREATKNLLDGLADAVLVIGRDLGILSLNDEACRLLGCGRTELEGVRLSSKLAPTDPLLGLVEETLARGESARSRSALLVVAGREVPFLLDAFVLRDGPRTLGVMITARDLERSSQIGSRLSHSQKLAGLGRLTSGVAHEIRNPLNALVLQAALLRQKLGPQVPDAMRHLDIIEEEVKRLDRVIDGFLRFTRPEELQLESVRLDGILREAMDLMAARAEHDGIRMEAAVAPDLPRVRGSAELLRQALLNLIGNALDAMPTGGLLRVRADPTAEGSIALTVEDTGEGIGPEQLSKVFNLFYTTRSNGSGIGLSLVYRIAQLHGGDVQIDSERGAGTRVTMTLPETAQ